MQYSMFNDQKLSAADWRWTMTKEFAARERERERERVS